MSKNETPMVDRWWAESGLNGVLAEEYPLVAKAGLTQRRRADAVVVLEPSGGLRKVHWRDMPPLAGRDTMVIQAKATPLCAPLAGQAIGSAWFLEGHGTASVHSVLLCTADDPVLRPLVEGYGVEVVVMPEFATESFTLAADRDRLTAWHEQVGGKLWRNVCLTDMQSTLRAHAVHVGDPGMDPDSPPPLDGLDVTVVTAQKRQRRGGTSFGMYAFGMAVLYRDLALQRGAATARTTVLTETTDPTIAKLCADFGVDVEEVRPEPTS